MSCLKPVKQFRVASTADSVPSTAQSLETAQLPSATNKYLRQVSVYVKTADMVIKFGGSTVAASNTVTSNAYADDNFYQPAGSIQVYDLRSDQTYVSVVAADGATAGTAYICLGNGENKNSN